ncbi:MAG: hypothetical protein WCW65_02045 [Candidatus Paceibacterota bacterium]
MNTFLTITRIKNLLKIIHNFFKINPHKHWNAFLYFFFILVSFSILFSIYLLYQIKSENIFQVKAKEQAGPVLLNESLLKSTLNLQEKKANEVLKIKNNTSLYTE